MATKHQEKQVPFHKNIVFSGISGAIATTCIYPLDITKTKLQDQKGVGKAKKYSGPLNCFMTILRTEGIRGIYRGWPPNVVLVMPEKAIKLTLNDVFRSRFKSANGDLTLGAQMAAGGLAGFFQVSLTNPMELLKIQGATMKDKLLKGEIKEMLSYPELTRRLGVTGLYTGVAATWLRDIPFSMVYFSLYSYSKDWLLDPKAPQSNDKAAFFAGAIAGTVAAGFTTPVDVIKTRVHSYATPMKIDGPPIQALGKFFSREVELINTNVKNLLEKEGATALFKGIVPRCMIISPLFAITMTCFEKFKEVFG